MPVRFSTRCPNSDYLGFEASPEAIVAAAKKAEEVGFDAIFVNDHIIVDGSPRAAPWTNVYDPFVAMSFIAAHTTRIGVGVSVLIMPYRNPVATAKSLATVDRMSGGRLIAALVSAGTNLNLRRSACHSTSGGRAPTNICASGRPVGRQARSPSPAGSFRSPTCMSAPSRCSSRIPRFGLAVPAMRHCAGRRASPRCGSRPLCPFRSWSSGRLRYARHASRSGAGRSPHA